MIERENRDLSLVRQCQLLALSRSSFYYQAASESAENLLLLRLLDEQYTRTPFYGVRRMTAHLQRQGYEVNHKRVARLMQVMGLQAIYPKPRLSLANSQHRLYPYLLTDVEVVRVNQVWSTDITYVRLLGGFVYLVAVLDWYSRYVLSWEVSNTMDVNFCLSALATALRKAKPEIFNSDQGSQFTSLAFTAMLEEAGVQISMDGRGRVFDNIFVERLWRTVKYEDIYLKEYASVAALLSGLERYWQFYNEERPHQALAYQTPAEVYFEG